MFKHSFFGACGQLLQDNRAPDHFGTVSAAQRETNRFSIKIAVRKEGLEGEGRWIEDNGTSKAKEERIDVLFGDKMRCAAQLPTPSWHGRSSAGPDGERHQAAVAEARRHLGGGGKRGWLA